MKRGPNYLIQVQLFCGSAARLDSFMPASRTNRQSAHPKRSRPGSKPKLKTLKKHKVIAGQNALDAWVLELIQVKVRFRKNPVVEIPVQAHSELIGVVAKRRDDSRRNRAGRDGGGIASCAFRSPLQPGIADPHRKPGPPILQENWGQLKGASRAEWRSPARARRSANRLPQRTRRCLQRRERGWILRRPMVKDRYWCASVGDERILRECPRALSTTRRTRYSARLHH